MKYFFLLLCFLDLAQAGVRTVGKGGGYAEMQAILANEQMQKWVAICWGPSSCGLSGNEERLLQAATATLFVLETAPTCVEPFIFPRNSHTAALSSCLLYNPDLSLARDFSEIATWVLTARLMTTQGVSLQEAHGIAEKVFLGYQQSEQSLSVTLTENSAVLHFLQIRRDRGIYNIFSIEGKSSALNITSQVQQVLTCERGSARLQSVGFLGAQELSSTRSFTEAEVTWSCGESQTYQATLQLYFSMSQSEILADSVLLRLVRKTEI